MIWWDNRAVRLLLLPIGSLPVCTLELTSVSPSQSMHRATPFSDQMEVRDMRRTTVFDDGPYAHGEQVLTDMPAA